MAVAASDRIAEPPFANRTFDLANSTVAAPQTVRLRIRLNSRERFQRITDTREISNGFLPGRQGGENLRVCPTERFGDLGARLFTRRLSTPLDFRKN